ncbi:MAG: methyltransferase domain-containing protein [Micrococcales bacterium]|nr:methyltransferase domain-containing protein [Micrococcales bacterium]NBR54878.1 methyltransferase domain-containing protein [Micrococcales bacterium]NBR61047.1 methyltransferase domain-containing protein [Actinomycetota bacterium]NDE89116.1 methyltransferase domain-containing protein [Micrococcales bacterium]
MSINHYFSDSAGDDLQPREITASLVGKAVKVFTSSGVFSPDHIDLGTEVLLKQLDKIKPSGNILDLGCGWGPIALAIALTAPEAKVTAVDVNQKSLSLTRMNAEKLNLKNITTFLPEQVPTELLFDEIWSNPPIRVGKEVLHEILFLWFNRLSVGGTARLVVQKHLGSDSLEKWLRQNFPNFEVTRVTSEKNFRVIKLVRN